MDVSGFLGRIGRALARAQQPGPPRIEVLWPYAPGSPARVGVVAGTFDPMTVAHAALATALGVDLVLFVYSPRTLPKEVGPGGDPGQPLLSARDRVGSLLAYVRSRPGFGVGLSSHGLYADQAKAVRATFPQAELVFGMGSDKLVQLMDPGWYGEVDDRDAALERLFAMSRVAYAAREGEEERVAGALAEASKWRDRIEVLSFHSDLAGISSRGVRERLARGGDVRALVPEEVLPFVTSPPVR